MKTILLILFAPFIVMAQDVPSGMYSWKKPTGKLQENVQSTTLFEGSAHDLAYVQMSANAIVPSVKKTSLQAPAQEEHLLIMKSGTLSVTLKDSSWSIGAGSIALIMPGEKYSIQNASKDSCT